VLGRICARLSATMRQLADTRAEKVGCTRFFRNDSVTVEEIVQTAAARTAQAAAGRDVLLIEDTSEVNYQSKVARKRKLGRVGNGTDAGLFVHPVLAVDAGDGSVLGLAGALVWRRTKAKQADYQSQPIETKESYRWIAAPKTAQAVMAAASRVTVIADREADIYELFARLPAEGADMLVRATHDRALADKGRLFAEMPPGTKQAVSTSRCRRAPAGLHVMSRWPCALLRSLWLSRDVEPVRKTPKALLFIWSRCARSIRPRPKRPCSGGF